jgi:competence protein ComEC
MPRAGWLAIGAITGALLAMQLPPAATLAASGATLAASVLAHLLRRRRLPWLALAVGLVLFRAAVGAAMSPAADVHGPEEGVASAPEHVARVLSVGTPDGGLQRAVLELQPPDPADRVYAWLPRYPQVVPTDVLRFDGRLEAAPDGPGFGEFLARSGIAFTLRAREFEQLGGDDSPIAALEHVRRGAGEVLARGLPEPQAGLAAAIIIGLRDLVARDVAADFRTAGLSHVVAISGWHVALVGGVIAALLSGLARRPRSLLLVAAIAAYAVLAGGAPSVVRAALMAGVVLLARESGRRGQAAAALGIAVLILLLMEPATVGEVGFQLSVAATAGLLRWASPLAAWLRPRIPRRVPDWLVETLAVSLSAQAATMPLVLLHFGRLSLVAPLANLLVAPLVAPVMLAAAAVLGAAGLAVIGVPAVLLIPITLIGALALGTIIGIADAAASLPFASVELEPPLDLVSACMAALALVALLRRRTQAARPSDLVERLVAPDRMTRTRRPSLRLALAAAGISLCLLLALVATGRPDGRLHMTVLDVGQGDSILLEGPTGGRMLVDTGPDPDRLIGLLDGRLPSWDRRLDLVVITHPHEDHVAGLALLLDRYRVGGVVEPGMVGPGPGDAAFRRRMAELGRETRVVAAGDRLLLDGVSIDIHWPLPGSVPLRPAGTGKEINNVSLVLDLHFGSRRFLLTGDVEEEIDPRLLAAGLHPPDGEPLDVLKVAHHGSGTATTDAFVEQMSPRVAVISAGWGNPYGHPSPGTVARLQDAGARLFRTDLDGTVQISTDGSDLVAWAGGGRPRPTRPTSQLAPGLGFCPLPQRSATRRRRPRSYNRDDECPFARRGSAHPARARAAALVHAPLVGRRRGGGVSRSAHRGQRRIARRTTGRGRGAAP